MRNAKLTYDKQADAVYLAFETINQKGVKQTVRLNEDILVDLDKDKKIIGIEILNASRNIAKENLQLAQATA